MMQAGAAPAHMDGAAGLERLANARLKHPLWRITGQGPTQPSSPAVMVRLIPQQSLRGKFVVKKSVGWQSQPFGIVLGHREG